MDTDTAAAFSLTVAAHAALSRHFGANKPESLRVFLSFWSESGPRLELAPDAPAADDVAFTVSGWDFVVGRQLWLQASPLTVDCGPEGFVIGSSLDFSEAGGSCGGNCGHHH